MFTGRGAPQIAEFVIAGFSGSGSVRNVQEFKFGVNLLFEVKMFLGKSGTLKEMIHSVHWVAEAKVTYFPWAIKGVVHTVVGR
jgi:hypothetical protein